MTLPKLSALVETWIAMAKSGEYVEWYTLRQCASQLEAAIAEQGGEVEITAMAACVCPSSPCAVHPMAATRGNREPACPYCGETYRRWSEHMCRQRSAPPRAAAEPTPQKSSGTT